MKDKTISKLHDGSKMFGSSRSSDLIVVFEGHSLPKTLRYSQMALENPLWIVDFPSYKISISFGDFPSFMISRGSSPSISVGLVRIPFASHSGTTGPKRAARPVQAGLYEDDDQTDVNSEYSRRDRSHRLEQEMRLVYHGFPCFFQWAFSMVCHGSEDTCFFAM